MNTVTEALMLLAVLPFPSSSGHVVLYTNPFTVHFRFGLSQQQEN